MWLALNKQNLPASDFRALDCTHRKTHCCHHFAHLALSACRLADKDVWTAERQVRFTSLGPLPCYHLDRHDTFLRSTTGWGHRPRWLASVIRGEGIRMQNKTWVRKKSAEPLITQCLSVNVTVLQSWAQCHTHYPAHTRGFSFMSFVFSLYLTGSSKYASLHERQKCP